MRRSALFALLAAAAMAVPGAIATQGSAAAQPPQKLSSRPDRPVSVTLITGDRVLVTQAKGGRKSVRIERGPGRQNVTFAVHTTKKKITVVPQDARALIAQRRVDPRLFDVSRLIAWKYDDSRRDDLPVIVSQRKGTPAASITRSARVTSRATRGITAARVRKSSANQLWTAFTTEAKTAAKPRLWLDGKVRVNLEQSVPQIGAPVAWQQGLAGKGVTVAVLDTGVDAGHQDLSGQVTAVKNFTESTTSGDRYGHGTHVASIIAGSGAASAGKNKGVAPDVVIANGKVLDDEGAGYDSWIIGGMDWAVRDAKAKVVNMSLGCPCDDPATDDPIKTAVATLSAETGALFVIAAGNSGPGRRTIETPGSATDALTVGAVDKNNAQADFSSVGPRVGDYALKPDITAPGVGIEAAKAGTTSGYVAHDGTSMATPHVAGAAAILAGQHPTWTGSQIKAALMGSAKPADRSVYEQGSGRVDIARAIGQTVIAKPASVSALLRHGADTHQTHTVTYTSQAASDVTLSLNLALKAGVADLDKNELTVPAGGAAEVKVTVRGGTQGLHGGTLLATSADGASVRVPISAYIEPPMAQVDIKGITFAGQPADLLLTSLTNLDSGEATMVEGSELANVPAGRYLVEGSIDSDATNSSIFQFEQNLAEGRHTLTLDARQTKYVRTTSDLTDSRVAERFVETEYEGVAAYGLVAVGGKIAVLPTTNAKQRLNAGSVQVKKGSSTTTPTPYVIHQWKRWTGGIPGDAVLHAVTGQMTKKKTSVRAVRTAATVTNFAAAAPSDAVLSVGLGTDVRTPASHTEYLTPGVPWERGILPSNPGPIMLGDARTYPAGTVSTERWNTAVIGPSANGDFAIRAGDQLQFVPTAYYSDATQGHFGFDLSATGTVKLSKDGTAIASAPFYEGLATGVSDARYQLSADGKRTSALSTRVRSWWTFTMPPAGPDDVVRLPLLNVRYAPSTDTSGLAKNGAETTMPIWVDQFGASVSSLKVEVSYDDGSTWKTLTVKPTGTNWQVKFKHSSTAKYVSLRASATDAAGNKVTQTITRAYGLKKS